MQAPMMAQDGEFGRMMQTAAAMKTEQVKADRRKYEASSQWLQHTLFQCVDKQVVEARNETDINKVR